MPATESRTEQLLALRDAHIPVGLATAHPIIAAKASGAKIWDVDGREYLDFAGGIAVMNVGHSHPRVIQAVRAQLERLTHTCFQVAMYEPYMRLAQRLNALAPGDAPKKTVFFSTGAEATENAVKIVRAATGRSAVVAFHGGFHGRTLMGMSLTGKSKPYKQNFGPFAPEVYHAPYPYTYRGWTSERSLEALDTLFTTQVEPGNIAAVILEPVLGEGGFVPAPAEFLQGLAERCKEHGILFIADEIQTGFGRTGKLFAIEHSSVVPDLITIAKSLAGGLPLSGVIGRTEVMDAPQPGGLGGTYAGNPLACAAALAVLDLFEEEGLLEQANRLGAWLLEGFQDLQSRYPVIGDVRGLGPMLALELVKDAVTKEPDAELTKRIIAQAREDGLLLLAAGLYGNVIREAVPLTVSQGEVEQAFTVLDGAFAKHA